MGREQMEFMEEISKAPIIVQTIMVMICGVFVITLLSKKINEVTRWLLLVSGLALLQNAGYLLVLQSKNLNEACIALKAEYIGGAYISTVSMLFVLAYCKKKLPKGLIWSLLGIDTCMVLGVWLLEYTTIYYTSVEYCIIGGTVKLVLGRGVLYYIGVFKIVFELLYCMYVAIREMVKVRTKTWRKQYMVVILALLIPNIAYLGLIFRIIKAYDPVPSSTAVTCAIMFFGVMYMHVFDEVYVAYADIVRQMKEPLIILNKDYCFVAANDSAKELVPQIEKLKQGDAAIRAHIIDDDLARRVIRKEECQLELNGRAFEVSVNDVVVDNKLRGYYLLLFDLTKERQQILIMQELKEEADKANQAKTTFLSNMSHEIRTPINAIMGMNEMILRNSQIPEITEYAQNIRFASQTLLSIVNDILDLSKIELGKMELLEGEYQLGQLLQDCYKMVFSRAKEKGLELTVINDANLPAILYGDELRIQQVIINLLTNAIKYTEKGNVTLEFAGKVIKEDTLQFEIYVKDTGIGLKQEMIEKMFDAFQRLDRKKNKEIEGVGLGLAITKQLVEVMGGTISVQSSYGIGSDFCVSFPQKIIDFRPMGEFCQEEKEVNYIKKRYQKQFEAPELLALVVDDVEINLLVMKGLLKETKMQIDTACSGKECIQKTKEKTYDIIFMDHMMPEMDGIETLQQMHHTAKCKNIDTPVIALTANAIAGVREKYLQAGFADYLSKPVEGGALESIIQKYVPDKIQRLEEERNIESKECLTLFEQVKKLFPQLNLAKAKEYCAEDENIYRMVLEGYCQQDFSEKLITFYQERDVHNYEIVIHGVKSSSLTLGLCELAQQAKELEQACKENNWDYVEANHEQVQREYVVVLNKLKTINLE